MKTKTLFVAAAVFASILTGCGGGGGGGGPAPEPAIPFRLDSIDTTVFPPPIVSNDFNASSRMSRPIDFFGSDAGFAVPIDVTTLMQDAQSNLLPYFEIRFRFDQARFQADPSTAKALIAFDDSGAVNTAPLLTVQYVTPGNPIPATLPIFSNRSLDGDISQDLGSLVLSLPLFASTTGNVLAGITSNQAGVSITDTRGFLTFSLSALPTTATVTSATLEVFVLNVTF